MHRRLKTISVFTSIVKDLGSISVDIAPDFCLLEEGSIHYHFPFAILILLEQVVDDLILCFGLASGIFFCIVEHLSDVRGNYAFALTQ